MTSTTPPTAAPTPEQHASSEQVAFAMLRLVGDHPGRVGRLRCARIVGGYAVAHTDTDAEAELARYALVLDWPLRQLADLMQALIDGGLIAQTTGPRPTLALTRAGHRALVALEAVPPAAAEEG